MGWPCTFSRSIDPSSRAVIPLNELPTLEVLRLGRIPYAEAHALQQQLVVQRLANSRTDTLVLCEHEPIITVGRGADPKQQPAGTIEVVAVERGGDATFHGPGQIVAYPVFELPPGKRDLHRYLRDLEQVVMEVLAEVEVVGERKPGATGVWVGPKKVCSIGVAVRRWVTWHGLALNLNVDLASFRGFRPCGLEAEVMANVSEFTELPPARLLFEVLLVKHFCAVFGLRLPDPPAPSAPENLTGLPIFPGS